METFSVRKVSLLSGKPLKKSMVERLKELGFTDHGNTYEIPLNELIRNKLPIAV